MRIQVGKNEKEWGELVWSWVHTQIQARQRVFLPAGNTPVTAYRKWCQEPSDHLRSLHFVQIDDILDGPMRGAFRGFFVSEMAPFLNQFEWINRADAVADVAILGVGVNGHVAFHEPSLPRDFNSGCVLLSDETRQYLNLADPTWGITYGVGTFLKCSKVLILARGEQKKQVLRQALKSRDLPIGWILEHRDVSLVSDFDF